MIITRKMAEAAWELITKYSIDPEEVGVHNMNADDVGAYYHAAARKTHPDMPGGSQEAFVAVDRAKHVLLKWLERPVEAPAPQHGKQCGQCDGKGFIMLQRALRALRVQCPRCRGAGELGVEDEKGDFM